ncbi:FeoC-like transcriptional regulator [Streptomyces sp. NPDC059917]|uniref:FeoC-like transcriptional regulator n=1 Tax=Streptomyces sp. NPDC059917 TaxID=3347002 RepID=UPI00364EEC16
MTRAPDGGPGGAAGPAMLRRLLREFEEAAPGEGLARIAARLGISTAEAAGLADYWVRKGRLKREEIGAPDCSGCFFASRGCTTCPDDPGGASGRTGATARPVLVALSPVRPVRPARSARPR